MNHLSFETLNQFLDQQLAPPEREEAQAHLDVCAECRAELGALQRINESLASLAAEPLPSELAPRVLAQIESAQRAWWVDALIVAETAAVIVLAFGFSEWLASLFDLIPDVSATVLEFQQMMMDILNAITIEPLENILPTEWLVIGSIAIAFWLVANYLLIQFPKQKEVLV